MGQHHSQQWPRAESVLTSGMRQSLLLIVGREGRGRECVCGDDVGTCPLGHVLCVSLAPPSNIFLLCSMFATLRHSAPCVWWGASVATRAAITQGTAAHLRAAQCRLCCPPPGGDSRNSLFGVALLHCLPPRSRHIVRCKQLPSVIRVRSAHTVLRARVQVHVSARCSPRVVIVLWSVASHCN